MNFFKLQTELFSSVPFQAFFILLIAVVTEHFPRKEFVCISWAKRKVVSFILKVLGFPERDPEQLLVYFKTLESLKDFDNNQKKNLVNLKDSLYKFEEEEKELLAKIERKKERKSLITEYEAEKILLTKKLKVYVQDFSLLEKKISEEKLESSEELSKYYDAIIKLKLKNKKIQECIDRTKKKYEVSNL